MTEEYKKVIEEIIYKSPLSLLSIKDKETIDLIREYLPYSTGFEIECSVGTLYDKEAFLAIPNILNADTGGGEQRFRIPYGIKGLVCLYNISTQLKLNCELNSGSGIHYHIDMSNYFSFLNLDYIKSQEGYILKELESWNYLGTYNPKEVRFTKGGWAGFRSNHLTLEIRIGEMTFDYELLVKRIIHCNNIVRTINEGLLDKEQIDSEIKNREDSCPDYKLVSEFIRKYHSSLSLTNERRAKVKLIDLEEELKNQRKGFIKAQEPSIDVNSIIKNRIKTNIKS